VTVTIIGTYVTTCEIWADQPEVINRLKISALTKSGDDAQVRSFLSCKTRPPILSPTSHLFIHLHRKWPDPNEYGPLSDLAPVHGADNEIKLLPGQPPPQIPNHRGVNKENVSTPKNGRDSSKTKPAIKLDTFIISGMVSLRITVQKESKSSYEHIPLRNLRNMMHYAG
jgi:hypothetical protein